MTQLHIFKAGTHTDVNGNSVTLTEADIAASAAAYNPALHEAPIVVGHPTLDAPAYGWVATASAQGANLSATPQQVDPAFAEMVEAGRFKKISTCFYGPNAQGNPVPGVYYIKHVGFLGAAAPAVKGLKTIAFSENTEGIFEFADWSQVTVASLLRRFRDWLLAKEGQDVADQVLPAHEIDFLRDQAMQSDAEPSTPAFAQSLPTPPTTHKEHTLSKEDTERLAALEAENKRLKEAEHARKVAATRNESIAFAEAQIKAQRFAPKHRDAIVEILTTASTPSSTGEVLAFGEGEERKPLAKALREFLAELPANSIAFGEQTATKARAASAEALNPLIANAEARAGKK